LYIQRDKPGEIQIAAVMGVGAPIFPDSDPGLWGYLLKCEYVPALLDKVRKRLAHILYLDSHFA
jgi:hypothetical protein